MFGKWALILILLISICLANLSMLVGASSATVQNSTYLKHNLSFGIPNGWNVIKDGQEKNDTQIVLSDGTNAIRIDLIKHFGIGKLIGDYLIYHLSKSELDSMAYNPGNLTDASWSYAYERYPWYSNDAVCDYYKENIVKPVTSGGTGSGISVLPDGVEYAGVSTNADSPHSVNEWIVAWTKPNYDEEIIGVHRGFRISPH